MAAPPPAVPAATPPVVAAGTATEAPVGDATIVAHETRREDKRFTVYKIELVIGTRKVAIFHRWVALFGGGSSRFPASPLNAFSLSLNHLSLTHLSHTHLSLSPISLSPAFAPSRYSEFRELYEKLKEAFPKEKFKFPSRRLIGNFDPDFIKVRPASLTHRASRRIDRHVGEPGAGAGRHGSWPCTSLFSAC